MLPPLLRTGCALLVAATLVGCGSGNLEQDRQDDLTVADAGPKSSAAGAPVQCSEPPALPASVPTFQPGDTPLAGEPGALTVRLDTTCGPITLALDGAAPQTVTSFAFLAEQGYWTDSPCHRLTTEGIYVLQCGDPTGTGRGGPGYTFGIENAPSDGIYPRGTLALARRTPCMLAATPHVPSTISVVANILSRSPVARMRSTFCPRLVKHTLHTRCWISLSCVQSATCRPHPAMGML